MSQAFSFDRPVPTTSSPFRLDATVAELYGAAAYVEPEVPDRELEEFEALHEQVRAELQSVAGEALESQWESGSDHPISRIFRVPVAALEALGKESYGAALALLGSAGYRSMNDLTNIVFYFRNPAVIGRKIRPGDHELQREWLHIRDTIVRPALAYRASQVATRPSATSTGPARTSIPSAGLRWYGTGDVTPQLITFMRAVYDRHVSMSDGTFVDTLPDTALKRVEGSHYAQVAAADAAIALLAAARAALIEEGLNRVAIGITSAYRSADRQFEIWQGKDSNGGRGFPLYYDRTHDERMATGDERGPQAIALLAQVMKKYIAAPGYSNHQDGLAFDFGTGEVGRGGLGRLKKDGWFHKWLVKNAGRFEFSPYAAEPWHWVYRPHATAQGNQEADEVGAAWQSALEDSEAEWHPETEDSQAERIDELKADDPEAEWIDELKADDPEAEWIDELKADDPEAEWIDELKADDPEAEWIDKNEEDLEGAWDDELEADPKMEVEGDSEASWNIGGMAGYPGVVSEARRIANATRPVIVLSRSTTSAETRAFHPKASDKSGVIRVRASFRNAPQGSRLRWSSPSRGALAIDRPRSNQTLVRGVIPGRHDLDAELLDADGSLLASTKISLSVPQYILITEDATAFDQALAHRNLTGKKADVIIHAKEVVDHLLRKANVRTYWQVGGLRDSMPSHVPASSLMIATIRNEDPNERAYGRTLRPAGVDKFNELIDLFPGQYDKPVRRRAGKDDIEVDAETQALFQQLESDLANDPNLIPVAIKVLGRLIGETLSHEVVHGLLWDEISTRHNAPPIANDLMNKGAKRHFTQRTGMENTGRVVPVLPEHFADHGVARIGGLQPANQSLMSLYFPVPPARL